MNSSVVDMRKFKIKKGASFPWEKYDRKKCTQMWQIVYFFTNHHHHHVVPLARISLTLSRHFYHLSLLVGSSGLHPVSSHSCFLYVRAGRPAFAWPYAGVHRGTSLMSSSLLLQQCPACLVRLTCIVFVMGGSWPYSWYYLPTPPLGQDMTQGQFLSWV